LGISDLTLDINTTNFNFHLMKKILFPTDFSENSKNAFVFALHLAKSIHAEIITLHVYQYPQVNYMEIPVYLPEMYEVTDLTHFENYKGHITCTANHRRGKPS